MARIGQQNGFILLPVVLAIVLIATIAFLINTESAINVDMTANTTAAAEVEQVARAGLSHATWGAQNSGCAGDMGMTTVPLGQNATGSYTATVTTPGGTTTGYPNLTPDQDAWFRSDNITNNNGTNTTYHLRMESGKFEYAVVRFDLSSLPAGAQINSAVAQFFVKTTKGHPEGPVTVHRVTADWTETGATWETMSDKYDSAVLATIPAQPAAGDVRVEVNLTAQVQAWVNGQANYGIMLIPTGEGTHAEYISREGTSGHRPKLKVIVGTGAASPMKVAATGTLTGNPSPANDITRTLTRTNIPALQPANYSFLQLQPGSGKDAMLSEWYDTKNYGDYRLRVESSASSPRYSLVQFDLAAVPAGARVLSAQLQLYHTITATPGADASVTVHRVNRDWVEGTQGGSGTADGVTWQTWDATNAWATAGGDHDPAPVANSPITDATGDWESWDISTLVQGWLDGTFDNNGLLLKGTGTIAVAFASKEDADPALHPKLNITYACECGTPCVAPQGSGRIALIGDDGSPDPDDQLKIEIIESWGYDVDFYEDQDSDTINWSNYDLAYVSETVISGDVSANVANIPISVVNEEPKLYDNFDLASGDTEHVGSSIDITDNSHYITAPFVPGALPIYDGDMEILTANTPLATGLQTLGEYSGAATLTATEKGAPTTGGPAAGRRVTLPLGQHFAGGFDWKHLNHNAHLLVQRAIAWGMGADKVSVGNVLLVVVNPGSLTAQEQAKQALMESWNFTVNLIDESDSQADFDTAIAANDVAYISEDINASNLGTKLRNATIGVVNEEGEQVDELGISEDKLFKTRHEIDVVDNTHYITQPFATGLLTFVSSDQSVHMLSGQVAPGLQTLGESSNVGAQWEPSLGTLDAGDSLSGGGTADGRRVQLPWGGGTFDINQLNDDGRTIMQRALEWGAGLDSGGVSYKVLLVVGDATTLASKDSGRKTLMESWGYTVTVIDDGESQANFDAAAAANDVVYVSGTVGGGTLAHKLTGSSAPIVNEFAGKLDNFGFSSSTSSTVNVDAFTTTNAAHYITEPFGGSPVTVFNGSLSMTVPGGTLAPELQNVGEVSGTMALVTLETGATRYDSNPAPARRAYLPFASAETTDLTADGETVLQRAIEWAAGANVELRPIAHWKLDETSGLTAVDSEGGNDGTLNNGPVWTPGTIDGGLDFDGSNDYVSTNSSFTPPPAGTVSFWMQVDGSPTAHGRILGLHDEWEIRHVTTGTADGIPYGLVFDLGVNGVNTEFVTTTTVDVPGKWYHIAASYDTATDSYAVYIDGVPHKSGTYSTGLSVPAANTLSLGTRTGSANYYDGMLDDVRIYDTVLTPAEIADLAAQGGGGGGGGGTTCTFRDEFENQSYSNQDGDANWAGDWQEVNDGGSPTGGDIRLEGGGVTGESLRIQDDDRPITRAADLSGHTSATLTLEYKRVGLENGEYVAVSVYDGSTWTELQQFGNPPVGNDSDYQTYSVDISSYISPAFEVRLASPDGGMGNADDVKFDNLEIVATGGSTCP